MFSIQGLNLLHYVIVYKLQLCTAHPSVTALLLLLLLLLLSHYTHFDFTDRYFIPPSFPFINTQRVTLLPWRRRQHFLPGCYILGDNDLAIPFSCHAVVISAVETV